jgi:uncharacterized membrane protein YkvA (DUF1232 family)
MTQFDNHNINTDFSEKKFWRKIQRYSKRAGVQVVYVALLLYYMMQSKEVPIAAKAGIAAALAYFILPADLIPDIALMIGYSDDIGVLLFTLSQLIDYITPEVREKARTKLGEWFGEIELKDVKKIEEKISGDNVEC